MQDTSELRILFATSFSDACFRTARNVAQLADALRVSLTIAHIARPGSASIQTRRELDSFMAEADHYDSCRRVLVESDSSVDALGDLCESHPVDLLIAPSSDRLGLLRTFRNSFRARLLQRCSVPLWTAGASLHMRPPKPSIQTIACLVDLDCSGDSHLRLAASLAARIGAALHLITVVEPVSEGTLARSIDCQAPLMPDVARERVRAAFGRNCPPVSVAVGDWNDAIPRLANECDADLLFVGPRHALDNAWRPRIASYLDKLHCPAICLDGASATFEGWRLHTQDLHGFGSLRHRALAS